MKLLPFITKQITSKDFQKIILLFISWKFITVVALLVSIVAVPLWSRHFLGGSYDNYILNPVLFSWANFDGEHYLAIAQRGYEPLNHSFFPLYPFLIKAVSFFSSDIRFLVFIGLSLSTVAFLLSLIILWKLTEMDYKKNVALWTTVALVVFPSSFYFGLVYTESLFLLLVLGSFYCYRKNKWWWAGILGGLASATRITGIFLLPALLIEWGQSKEKKLPLQLLLIPIGLGSYMAYLYLLSGDPFLFYNELFVFGQQRQGNFVLLPQVFYRYIFMLATIGWENIIFWTILLEFTTSLLSVLLIIIGFILKLRPSYLVF